MIFYNDRQFAGVLIIMEEVKYKKNIIYKVVCTCICLSLWFLSYFEGRIYLSSNGFAILKGELISPSGLNDSGQAKYYIQHELIVNGVHYYVMYIGGEEYLFEAPEGALRFSASSATYGFTDFYVVRKNGKFRYKIYQNGDISSYKMHDPEKRLTEKYQTYQKEMDMVFDFIVANWSNFYLFGHVVMRESHAGFMIFFLGLLFGLQFVCKKLIVSRLSAGRKKDIIYQRICYGTVGFIHLIVLFTAIFQYITFL